MAQQVLRFEKRKACRLVAEAISCPSWTGNGPTSSKKVGVSGMCSSLERAMTELGLCL